MLGEVKNENAGVYAWNFDSVWNFLASYLYEIFKQPEDYFKLVVIYAAGALRSL